MGFYDGTKLLSMKDINGDKPEIYLCTANRSAGKTTYFNRHCVKKFLDNKEKFALLYRFNYELDEIADKFFKDIGNLFFKDFTMRSERKRNGIYHHKLIRPNKTSFASVFGYTENYFWWISIRIKPLL